VTAKGADREPSARARYGGAAAAVAIAFGLLFAYDLFEAVSNLVGVVGQIDAYNVFARENGLQIASIPWVLLIVTVALPPTLYGAAWWIGRSRGLGMRALLFVGGLAVVAAVTLSLTALA
jgi:hypothetical protein